MTKIEALYLQYYNSINKEMMKDTAPFGVMTDKLMEQFKTLGLTNEEKAKSLVSIYAEEIKFIDSEASKAALSLLRTEEANLTEERKRQGYDDNVLIEIMKAQGGLASFAVNANSDSAQDTIDDLHAIMDKVEDRVCDLICNIPSFDIELTTDYATPISSDVYGGAGLTYLITVNPELGVIVIYENGVFAYTPQNDIDGIGRFKAIITATDESNGFVTATVITIDVTDVVTIGV